MVSKPGGEENPLDKLGQVMYFKEGKNGIYGPSYF